MAKTRVLASLREFFAGPLRRVEEEQRTYLADPKTRHPDWETIVVMLTVAVMLTLQSYLVTGYRIPWTEKLILALLPERTAERLTAWLQARENAEFVRLARWTFGNLCVYVFGPMLVIKLVLRRKISDYGSRLKGTLKGWPIYIGMFLFMSPFIYLASLRKSFQDYYPFYRLLEGESLWPRFIAWEILYALQFMALEFFFRGFMLHGTRRRLGVYAIFAMTIPYCMIHYGKPMPETFGAIGAGIALGFMSFKTQSIWLGAGLHISVAWTMDALAIGS